MITRPKFHPGPWRAEVDSESGQLLVRIAPQGAGLVAYLNVDMEDSEAADHYTLGALGAVPEMYDALRDCLEKLEALHEDRVEGLSPLISKVEIALVKAQTFAP